MLIVAFEGENFDEYEEICHSAKELTIERMLFCLFSAIKVISLFPSFPTRYANVRQQKKWGVARLEWGKAKRDQALLIWGEVSLILVEP